MDHKETLRTTDSIFIYSQPTQTTTTSDHVTGHADSTRSGAASRIDGAPTDADSISDGAPAAITARGLAEPDAAKYGCTSSTDATKAEELETEGKGES